MLPPGNVRKLYVDFIQHFIVTWTESSKIDPSCKLVGSSLAKVTQRSLVLNMLHTYQDSKWPTVVGWVDNRSTSIIGTTVWNTFRVVI